tara:strand:+ start:53 stop:550 length:498 start_codon:yes stop_codon:yes gene_type:complete
MTHFDLQQYGFPDEETLSCQDGLYENHHYRDLRGYGRSDYSRLKAEEVELLEYDGDPNSDEALQDLEDNEVWIIGLDPGVASTVIALLAIGAVPFTSCSGGPGHYEQHPLVAFWAREDQMTHILAAAEQTQVEVCAVNSPGFLVYTLGSEEKMMNFADELIQRTG